MATEKVLKIKSVSEVAEAISGLKSLEGSLKGVGTAAFEASGKSKAQWKELEATWKTSTAAAGGLATQAIKAETALNAMGRATNAGQLEKSLIAAQIEVSRLSEKMVAAAAAGNSLDDGATASLATMRAALDAGKAKLEDLRSSTERARKELGLLGEEGKRAGAAVAGVSTGTERVGDSMRKSSEGVMKFRGAALELWGALGTGKMIGEALAAAIDKTSARMAVQDKATADAAVNTIKFQQAMKLAEKGLIDIGGSQEDFLRRYDAYIAKTSPATQKTRDQTKALEEQAKAWKELGDEIDRLNSERSFKLVSPDDAFMPLDEAQKYADRLNEILGKAFKEGGAAGREEWFNANRETIEKIVAAYEHFGLAVPDQVKAAYDAILADKGAQRVAEETAKWLAWEAAAYEENAERVRKARGKEAAEGNRTSRAPEEFKRYQDAAFGAAVAAGELGTNLDRVAEAVVATGGQMVVGAPMMFEMARATDEAVRATVELVEATKRLREEQTQNLEATRGWLDYVTNLREGYESGQNSLISYISSLQDFATQLRTLFAGATGEAAESIQNMIDLINTLIATAGANAPTTSGNRQLDELNRHLDKGR